jgi:hypothetical protein
MLVMVRHRTEHHRRRLQPGVAHSYGVVVVDERTPSATDESRQRPPSVAVQVCDDIDPGENQA